MKYVLKVLLKAWILIAKGGRGIFPGFRTETNILYVNARSWPCHGQAQIARADSSVESCQIQSG